MRLTQYLVVAVGLITGGWARSQSREPLNYLSLVENARIRTPSKRVHAYTSFDLTFDLHKQSEHVRLSLQPNYDILHEDAQMHILNSDGTPQRTEKINREDYKVYLGQAYVVEENDYSTPVGWARVVIRRDGILPLFEGTFSVNGNMHHIQMKSTYTSAKHALDPHLEEDDDEYMVVWRDSDVGWTARTMKREQGEDHCNSESLAFNTDLNHPIFKEILSRSEGRWAADSMDHLLGKRQSIDGGTAGNGNSAGVNLRSTIGNSAGCPTTRKVALVGIATDCNYAQDFNSTDSMKQNVINVINSASEVYQSMFNITLALRDYTPQSSNCPGTPSPALPWNLACNDANNTDINGRLNLFSQWRASQNDTNAYWSLFSKCNTGAEIGLAWLGQLCNHGGTTQAGANGTTSTVSGANFVARTSNEWQVFAHETGHTFGAVHDCDSQTCQDPNFVSSSQCCPVSATACDANAQYIMNPYSISGMVTFSPCTVGNICSAMGRNSVQSSCLTDNKGVVTVSGSQCGNGIVEEGEDCDCGGTEACGGDTCCDPTTCKFTSGSVCDPANEGCCTQQCQFAASSVICRASTGQCDPAETCSGTNGTCPADQKQPDGTACGTGLQCASGQCTSRDQQCKTAMGSYTQGNQTYACNANTCQIECGSPTFGSNVCYSLQQNFLDGTVCNGDGRCANGVCQGATTGGEIKSWIQSNKTLVIVLATVLGSLLIFGILGCCVRACMRPKPRPRKSSRRQPPLARMQQQAWEGPVVPEAMRQRGYGANGGGFGPVPSGQAPTYPVYPSYPTPIYNGGGGGGVVGAGGAPRGHSVRYA